jgi:PhnB protein
MQTVSPYLLYEDVAGAVDWLTATFGFRELLRWTGEDGSVGHAEMDVGGGTIYLGDPGPDYRNPKRLGAVTVQVAVYVDDVDAHYERVTAAGAEIRRELQNEPYGERRFDAYDPEGHLWMFSQRVRELAPEEWGAVTA